MALRIFSAYLEGRLSIKVKMPAKFNDRILYFSLSVKDQPEQAEIPLITSEYYKDGDDYIYYLTPLQTLDLDCHYLVHDADRNQAHLTWGSIVRSSEFDDHFYYAGNDLGANYSPKETFFKLWAPISEQVLLLIGGQSYPMQKVERGVWQLNLTGDWDGMSYYYLHRVNGKWQETQDPYALSAQANSGHSFVIDPEKIKTRHSYQNPHPINNAVIYEMSVRDFSAQTDIPFKQSKKYLGLTESPQYQGQTLGFDYVKQLGVTHVQLLPVYDFASVDENKPDAVYNWGYDPMLYNVPEGSFASNPHDPYARIKELQAAIQAYHEAGIGLIMDVVYNHVYDVDRFVFEKIVPGYCSRFGMDGRRTNGTGCGNDMATERLMVRKFIVDSILIWVKHYGFDGFRFDLMGILDTTTMLTLEKAVRDIYPNIYLYGEGWQMGTGLDNRYLAHQFNSYQLPGIGFFNDRFRDEFKKILCHSQHLVAQQRQSVVEELLTGSVGVIEQNGRYLLPSQSLNYLECHDNATFFDYLDIHHPGLNQGDKEARASFGLQLILLAQGIAFIHSGQEAFRTKNLLDNTYNQPDDINRLDWLRIGHHKSHVSFISQLIEFRKSHPILSLTDADQMREKLNFYWFNSTVLQYSLCDIATGEDIEIIINLGEADYIYNNPAQLDLYMQAPRISLTQPLEKAPKTLQVGPMSLAILMKTELSR